MIVWGTVSVSETMQMTPTTPSSVSSTHPLFRAWIRWWHRSPDERSLRQWQIRQNLVIDDFLLWSQRSLWLRQLLVQISHQIMSCQLEWIFMACRGVTRVYEVGFNGFHFRVFRQCFQSSPCITARSVHSEENLLTDFARDKASVLGTDSTQFSRQD